MGLQRALFGPAWTICVFKDGRVELDLKKYPNVTFRFDSLKAALEAAGEDDSLWIL